MYDEAALLLSATPTTISGHAFTTDVGNVVEYDLGVDSVLHSELFARPNTASPCHQYHYC